MFCVILKYIIFSIVPSSNIIKKASEYKNPFNGGRDRNALEVFGTALSIIHTVNHVSALTSLPSSSLYISPSYFNNARKTCAIYNIVLHYTASGY